MLFCSIKWATIRIHLHQTTTFKSWAFVRWIPNASTCPLSIADAFLLDVSGFWRRGKSSGLTCLYCSRSLRRYASHLARWASLRVCHGQIACLKIFDLLEKTIKHQVQATRWAWIQVPQLNHISMQVFESSLHCKHEDWIQTVDLLLHAIQAMFHHLNFYLRWHI